MTDQDREKWDSRYSSDIGSCEPSITLQNFSSLAFHGNALDIACGNGRNSIFLADKGFVVDAVDISTIAVNNFTGVNPNINVICQDIDFWEIPSDKYDIIVNIRFLDRRLFPIIKEGLKPGGVLIFESFLGREKNKYCLKQNELLDVFKSFYIVYYKEEKLEYSNTFDYTVSFVAIKSKVIV